LSLAKSIISGKEHRKLYRGTKAKDYSCHNHCSCKWCENNRLFFDKKKRKAAEQDLKEFINQGE